MKRVPVLVLLAALVLALAPEFPRYVAERRVGFTTAAFREILDQPAGPATRTNVLALGALAVGQSSRLPGDPRPWILAGSAYLVTGQPPQALEYYRQALATGERAEIVLNLGRAYALMKQQPSAETAFVRAGWISPEILASLSPAVADPVREQISKYAHALAEGRLKEPPPLPEGDRP